MYVFFFQREQLRDHEQRVIRLEAELEELRSITERGAKGANLHNNREKEAFLHYEVLSGSVGAMKYSRS